MARKKEVLTCATTWINFQNIKVKEANHRRPHIIWFQLLEMSRTGKTTKRENRFVAVEKWLEGERQVIANGYGVVVFCRGGLVMRMF